MGKLLKTAVALIMCIVGEWALITLLTAGLHWLAVLVLNLILLGGTVSVIIHTWRKQSG